MRSEMISLGPRITFAEDAKRIGFFPNIVTPTSTTAVTSHVHDFFELPFVIEGNARHVIGERVYDVQVGDMFFLNNIVPHHFVVGRGEAPVIVNFAFLPEFLDRAITFDKLRGGVHFFLIEPFLRDCDNFGFRLNVSGNEFHRLRECALLSVDAFTGSYPEPSEIARDFFRIFLRLTTELYEAKFAREPSRYTSREAIFEALLAELDKRISTTFTITDLAQTLGYSITHISNVFRKCQGESIITYVNRRRVESAMRLLTDTDMGITPIAFEVGFNDLSHFNRVFKQIAGMPPRSFRRVHK